MNVLQKHINELKTSEAFTRQSKIFDTIYGEDAIIQYKRKRTRDHILAFAKPNGRMLELNCGTGEDAIFFAKKGFSVHATDISEGMLSIFQNKLKEKYFENLSIEQCSFTNLGELKNTGPFDHIYSNFGGLNCAPDLQKVLNSFSHLIKPGGSITLVIISKFCLWETLLVFRGKFKAAFRRFFSHKGRKAHVEGKLFKCWYYSPSFIKKALRKEFDVLSVEGLCTLVPPSYIERFAEKHPRLFPFLKRKENQLKTTWPWKLLGDYFIISMRKKN